MKKINKLTAILTAVVVCILAMIAMISLKAFHQSRIFASERMNTHILIQKTKDLLLGLTDLETRQRGFLLTGEVLFLEKYQAIRDDISPQIQEIRKLSLDADNQNTIDALSLLISKKIENLSINIALKRENDMASLLASITSLQAESLMDSIRAEMKNVNFKQEADLQINDEAFKSSIRFLFIVIMSVIAFMLVFMIFLVLLVYRDMQNTLKNEVQQQTLYLLKTQEEINARLQKTNLILQISEEKLAITLNSIGDAVIVTDTEACITLINPVAQKLTGWTESEALGRSEAEVFKIISEETNEPLISPIKKTIANGSRQDLTNHTVLVARNGIKRVIADSCAPIRDNNGLVLGAILVFRDTTERRETEKILEKTNIDLNKLTEELTQTAKVKSEFLANMSHELRTPLNTINGFSEVLFDETFGSLNEKQKKYVNNVLTSGKHLLSLIDQILDMAKVEAGKMRLSLSVFSIKNLLQGITALLADMILKKKIEMILEIPEDLPDIEADELKLKEIIYNLVSNAVKFSNEDSRIGISVKNLGAELEIIVWDKGIGIAEENMDKIFEGFFMVDTPFSRITEGTGLGLPLSKALVELHGGNLSVVSEGLNKGSLVRFTLPIVQEGSKNETKSVGR